MLGEFILLTLVTIFIVTMAPKRRVNIWLAVCVGVAACGSFTVILWTQVIPYVSEHYSQYPMLVAFFQYLHIALSIFAQSQIQICLCIVFLTSAGYWQKRYWSSALKFVLLMNIPILFINIIYKPIDWVYNLEHSPMMWGMYHWLYIPTITCIILYLKSLKERKNQHAWNERFAVYIMIFLSIYALIVFYTCPMLRLTYFFMHFQPALSWVMVGIFVYILIRQGTVGIKINLELNRLDESIKTADANMLFINHAIKGEISKIQSCSELLDEESKVYRGIIDRACGNLLEMLEHAKNQLQEIVIVQERVDVGSLIKQVVSGYQSMMDQQGFTMEFTVSEEDAWLTSDSKHLYGVVDNVIKNSIEALMKEKQGHIAVEVRGEPRELVIIVQDNGCGMDQEQLKEVRKPFYTTKQREKNYGLGMTYCYRVVKKMKGRITIDSMPGAGSTVWVHLKR